MIHDKYIVYKVSRSIMAGEVSFEDWMNQDDEYYPEVVAILDDLYTAKRTARELPFFETIGSGSCEYTHGAWSEIHRAREASKEECTEQEIYFPFMGKGYAIEWQSLEDYYPEGEAI